MSDFKSATGTENNKVRIGGITELFGDPNIKIEKPYTIVTFPGGSLELSRCTNGDYWVHVATHTDLPSDPQSWISEGRIDASDRYCDLANRAMKMEIDRGGVNHIAFRISPVLKKG